MILARILKYFAPRETVACAEEEYLYHDNLLKAAGSWNWRCKCRCETTGGSYIYWTLYWRPLWWYIIAYWRNVPLGNIGNVYRVKGGTDG